MKVYHFFAIVATGKEIGAIRGDKLRFRTSHSDKETGFLPNLSTVTKYSNPKSFMRICRGSAPVPTPA